MHYELTEKDLKEIEDWDNHVQRCLASIEIGDAMTENDKFDRRKIGKPLHCPFCKRQFNPFYAKTLKEGKWDWSWVGDSHREPRSHCEVKCPSCQEQLFFDQYVSQ